MTKNDCGTAHHDYENAVRKGRAHWVCPKCGKDITLELVLLEECERETRKLENRRRVKVGKTN